ncbi:MAG: hypothetical protein H7246_19305 [Phycisphaerae bacterium]|nr:hypothetical protein [Saprospiraceae bacterium]
MATSARINQFFSPKRLQWLGALAAALFLLLLARPIFKDYFTRPNSMMYSFGGDALVLYYNTAYHTRYDDGSTLRNMNYPDGEYIYLTDAQGALSNTLQWINRHVTDISGQTVGIVNALNLYLLFAAVVLVFFLLRALKAHLFTAILFSPLIVLLSPQICRSVVHFGLAYPFLIPMGMLWFIRKYNVGRLEKRDALMLAVSVFFTFNNPYTGFNVNFFLVLAGMLLFAAEGFKRKNWKRPAIISGMGLLVLVLVFLNFKLFDPVHDRMDPQWGFFDYHATFEGLFHPPHSLLHDWLTRNKIKIPEIEFEAMLNVGLVATLALAVMLLMTIASVFYRKNKPTLQRLAPEHRILLGSTLLLFLLAANTSLLPISREWMETNMGWLMMFKASGRLGWGLYFALTVTGALFIDKLFRITSPWFMATLFSVLFAALWNSEINQYIRPKFRDVFQANFFSREHEQEMLDVLHQNNIDVGQYQAILCLPKMMAWSDKILSHINYRTQIYSTRISMATGLPMVNSMLSRIGLQHTLERVQMLSNPLVERTMLQKFPNQKDILLLVGSDAIPELKTGEKYLLDISERVAETKDFSLYRLRLADLANSKAIQQAKSAFQSGTFPAPSLHLGYDDQPSSLAFYGAGCRQTKAKEDDVFDFVSPFERDTQMVFSGWTYVDPGKWSAGFWLFSVRDAAGAELENFKVETRQCNDVQGNWIRGEARVRLPRGGHLQVKSYGHKAMLIDEVMLWPLGVSPIVNDPNAETFLFENFKVKK